MGTSFLIYAFLIYTQFFRKATIAENKGWVHDIG
jgi:hypothetical protein